MSRTRRLVIPALVAVLAAGALTTAWPSNAEPRPASGRVVLDGKARFMVLSPTLIRFEYADDEKFEDRDTFNVVDRERPVPAYETSVEDGTRVIRTARMTLRYKQGSGPFTRDNLTVELKDGTKSRLDSVGGECGIGQGCEAEKLTATGGARHEVKTSGFSGSGYLDKVKDGRLSWRTTSADAGERSVRFRYSNGHLLPQKVTVRAGESARQVELPTTTGGWKDAEARIELPEGSSEISISGGDVQVDRVAVTEPGAQVPDPPKAPEALGGWRRSLDGKAGAARMFDGLLTKAGWQIIDDTRTAILNSDGSTTARPKRSGSYQDGYFFGYGRDFRGALKDLRDVTGPAELLPRWAFGVWFSRWEPISDSYYRNTLVPAFRKHNVPLDVLVLDTNFKAPHFWNGWQWSKPLFPDPEGFMKWTKEQGLQVSANVHPSMVETDPAYEKTQQTAGGTMRTGNCFWTTPLPCKVFDWSDPKHMQAYMDLHEPFERQGMRSWWLDWCCDSSNATEPGVTPDTKINAAYADRATAKGQRGFAFSRTGSAWLPDTPNDGSPLYPAGPWAEHRYSAQFTGDTFSTWDSLKFQVEFAAAEGSIGMPYITHDIGGFNGLPSHEMYARWVQLGTFQPILRLHGNHAPRLPWEFPGAAQESAEKFLRLREALVPYTYSLARQAYDEGLPINRALYLNYPEHDEAYESKGEYLYGDDVLVAPVTSENLVGDEKTRVWFPPGKWTDYFTGKTYTGPSTQEVTTGLDRMPVFLRQGGILTTRTDDVPNVDARPLDKVTVDVATGGSGAFTLYEDKGEGLGYQDSEHASTKLSFEGGTMTIEPRKGDFPGAVADRTWTARFHDVASDPAQVTVNGGVVPHEYDKDRRTVTVRTPKLPTTASTTISLG